MSGCEYVIALTHMKTDNDVRLAEKVPEIDLILGGHNLVYEKRKVKKREGRDWICQRTDRTDPSIE